MPNDSEVDIIIKERDRTGDSHYRSKIIVAIASVENMLNGLKLLIVHQYLDYLEGSPTILSKFLDVFTSLEKLNSKTEKGE